ncbi:MAG: hypothetical protein ACRD0Q_02975 [Acidimicrobiales bacterium]
MELTAENTAPTKPQPAEDGPRIEPFGPTTRARQIVGAVVVMAGAIPTAMIAGSDTQPLYRILLVIGGAATLGWLIDGSRYVGAGSAALALGLAFIISEKTELDLFALLFGLLAAQLFIVSHVNPRAVKGTVGLFLYVATTSLSLHGSTTVLPRPWIFAIVMLLWGGLPLRRAL